MTFAEKVRGTLIAVAVLETRTRSRYYDHDSLATTFGDDHRERYWDETDGRGALHKTGNGETGMEYRDFRGNRHEASPAVIEEYLGPELNPTADDDW